jgi:biopolymer transport protein ExbD
MAMNVPIEGGGEEQLNSTINTTPLVDVMLVMLIIFLITIPVITHTIPVDLPKDWNIPTQTKPENITVAVDKEGTVYWNGALVPDDTALFNLIASVAVKTPQPEVHIRGDREARYEYIGRVVFLAQRGGIHKIGFITEPPVRG